MELLGDALIQVRIGVAENDPDRTPELFQLGDHLCAGTEHRQQVFVQAEEGGPRTRRGVELLVEQRHKLIPDVRVSEKPPDCHQYIRRKIQLPNIRDTGRAMFRITRVE
jgi:hypothetical protein